jgi:hypothetical protein
MTDNAAKRGLAADALAPTAVGEALWIGLEIGLEPADERMLSAVRVAVQVSGNGK